MKKLVVAMFAIASISASATSIRIPSGLTVDFMSLGSGIAMPTLSLVRKAIANELKAGHINVYSQKAYGFEGETRICVEAKWDTLAKLWDSFEKMAVPADKPAPKVEYMVTSCSEAFNPIPDGPVAR